jgi:hypothetical protein
MSTEAVTPRERADRLRERIYVTFTSLAVVLALRAHEEEETPGRAAVTLVIVVTGTLLAVLVADFTAHLAVHGQLPTRREFRHMIAVVAGSLPAIAVPLALVAAAALGLIELKTALTAAAVVLVATLVVVGYAAVRRTALPGWQRLVVLFAEATLGLAVIALELLAHG